MSDEKLFAAEEPMDVPSALERIGGDEDFLRELLDLFLTDFSEKFIQLQRAVADGNFSLIREVGHSLKGASGNLSLLQLQKISQSLERAGKENNLEEAEKRLPELPASIQSLKDFLAVRFPSAG